MDVLGYYHLYREQMQLKKLFDDDLLFLSPSTMGERINNKLYYRKRKFK